MWKLMYVAVMLFASNMANSADWHTLQDGKIIVEIDRASIVSIPGGMRKAWISYTFDEKQITTIHPIVAYKSNIQLAVVNCSQRTTNSIQEVFYAEDFRMGKVLDTRSYGMKNLTLTDVVPGSIGEEWMEYACRWNPKPKRK